MAKLFFIVIIFSGITHAQIFSLPFRGESAETPVDKLIASLGKLDAESLSFEESFKTLTSDIERQLDFMRSECMERTGDGTTKERCFREVVSRYKKYLENSYAAKKELLKLLHKKQLTQLDESKEVAIKELEKQF